MLSATVDFMGIAEVLLLQLCAARWTPCRTLGSCWVFPGSMTRPMPGPAQNGQKQGLGKDVWPLPLAEVLGDSLLQGFTLFFVGFLLLISPSSQVATCCNCYQKGT